MYYPGRGDGRLTGRRLNNYMRDNILGCLNKTVIKRLAARGGVGRMSRLAPEEIRGALRVGIDRGTYYENLDPVKLSMGNIRVVYSLR